MDYPKFDLIRGAPDRAHLHHHGGRLVDFVFRLVDRHRARRFARRGAVAQVSGKGPVEIQERPPAPDYDRPNLRRFGQPDALDGLPSTPLTSRDFLCGSARTSRLQMALLAGVITVLAVVLVQVALERTDRQVLQAQNSRTAP